MSFNKFIVKIKEKEQFMDPYELIMKCSQQLTLRCSF